jgi:alpha-N-arabinofuranosidase
MRAAAQLEFRPAAESQAAGLVLRQNEQNHYELRVTGAPQRRIELLIRVKGVTTMQASAALPEGPVTLQVESFADRYQFSFGSGGAVHPLGSAPTAPLSSELAGGFTGVFIGMFAEGAQAMPPADFDWFDYEALEE